MATTFLYQQLRVRREFFVQLVVLVVGLHGIFIMATTLIEQLGGRPQFHINDIDINIPLLIGLGLIYLSTLLRRRKRTAWIVALAVYTFILCFYSSRLLLTYNHVGIRLLFVRIGLPLLILLLLSLNHRTFRVRSDIRSFGFSLRFSLLILAVAMVYGTSGFLLMDKRDFHEEITVPEAIHRTIDQFGLTSSTTLTAHTRRAHVFLASLSIVSIGAIGYAAVSLFQPIRARYTSQHDSQLLAEDLLSGTNGKSEDYFKLWPHDKLYAFSDDHRAALAYKVRHGVALVVGDPIGDRAAGKQLLAKFQDICYGNDWLPAFVHTEPDWSKAYQAQGWELQKLGEEAVVDLGHFNEHVRNSKYFRQIRNKFTRQDFVSEVLLPPHSTAVIARLQTVSDDWLLQPGRAERGFMMGYFDAEYLQQGPIIVARDSAGTIQGFLNQIPSYDPQEANFDMLRHAKGAPGNINDFILLYFIEYLTSQGIQRLNLGLCPLAGLHDTTDKSVINSALKFLYSNGDRFYSFSGLMRFKSKYEPVWSDRYLAYPAGARNFARIMTALNQAMKVKAPKK